MSIRRTRGFTVVEMLVVIAIIGVLVALLLPAVQMAREAARRIGCSNNLSQLGKASVNYETSKGNMPPLRAYRQGLPTPLPTSYSSHPQHITSWVHSLLPYIERTDIHDRVLDPSIDVRAIQFSIKPLTCSSDVTDTTINLAAKVSYAANGGRENDYSSGLGTQQLPVDWPANGALDDRLKGTNDQFKVNKTTLGDISNGDGTTNTLLFAENRDLFGWNNASDETNCAVLWVVNAADQPPLNKDSRDESAPLPISVYYARPSSGHPSGFNVAFCDGSVKFINDAIGGEVYAKLMSSNGRKYKEPRSNVAAPTVLAIQSAPLSDGSY